MIRVVDGEQLPAPEPPHWQQHELRFDIDPFNPVRHRLGIFIVGGMLRDGARAAGRLGCDRRRCRIAGLVRRRHRWRRRCIVGVHCLPRRAVRRPDRRPAADAAAAAAGPGRLVSGGGWSGSSSSDSGGFSGGGGSFGGGGASGSW